ncbi:MAG: redoxin domain-containing protein, partial [Rickettsiales bacterium]|nr:redoxin domain-containing protein [Rickettsiales bacterium]
MVKIYVFDKLIEPDFETDYHNNPILAEHGIIELKNKIDINEFHVANASDQSIYTMSSFNGKILVLIVWSTNCTICNVEMRTISGLTNRIKTESEDELQFVTIADQHSDP